MAKCLYDSAIIDCLSKLPKGPYAIVQVRNNFSCLLKLQESAGNDFFTEVSRDFFSNVSVVESWTFSELAKKDLFVIFHVPRNASDSCSDSQNYEEALVFSV